MSKNNIAAVRVAFGTENPMPCLKGRQNKKGPGIFYMPGATLEIVRLDEQLNKYIIQEFSYGILGAHDEMLFSPWALKKEQLKTGASYRFAGMGADVRFPNMSLDFQQEKSLVRGRFTLLNHRGDVGSFAGANFLVKYEELEVQHGNTVDIWSPKVIGKRGSSGCAIPGTPLADWINMHKAAGFDVSLESTDLELMQKTAGEVPEGELFMPVTLCDNVIPQGVHVQFGANYSQWAVVSVDSLREAGLDRTLKEYDDAQVARAKKKEAARAQIVKPQIQPTVAQEMAEDPVAEIVTPAPEAQVISQTELEMGAEVEVPTVAQTEDLTPAAPVVEEEPVLVAAGVDEPVEKPKNKKGKKARKAAQESPVTE